MGERKRERKGGNCGGREREGEGGEGGEKEGKAGSRVGVGYENKGTDI